MRNQGKIYGSRTCQDAARTLDNIWNLELRVGLEDYGRFVGNVNDTCNAAGNGLPKLTGPKPRGWTRVPR